MPDLARERKSRVWERISQERPVCGPDLELRRTAGWAERAAGVDPAHGRGGHALDGVVTPPPTMCANPSEGMLACAAGYIRSAPDRVAARAKVFGWEPHGTGFRKCDGTYCWYRTRADFAI